MRPMIRRLARILLWTAGVILTLVLLTGVVCHYARLDESLRSAYAASAIVTLGTDTAVWFGSLDRVLAVVVGCAMALLVGLAFAPLTSRARRDADGVE